MSKVMYISSVGRPQKGSGGSTWAGVFGFWHIEAKGTRLAGKTLCGMDLNDPGYMSRKSVPKGKAGKEEACNACRRIAAGKDPVFDSRIAGDYRRADKGTRGRKVVP